MPKVIFKFDKEKDLWNNWDTVNYKSPWEKDTDKKIIPKLTKICKGKKFEECKEQLNKFYKEFYKSPVIQITVKAFQESWNKINDEFFKRLEKIMKKHFPFKKVTAYLTSQGRCPYKDKEGWFMVSFFSNIFYAMMTAGHELMHIHFHNTYWPEIEKQIGYEKTTDLKEALTVLLNLEFKDLWFIKDKGYPKHLELRKFIAKEWKKEKDFDVLMKKCVKYLKKMKSTKEILNECLNQLNPKNVLDLGIGSGRCSIRFLKKGASITGVDRIKKELPSEINFIKKDIRDFIFSKKYELIIANLILHFLKRQEALNIIKKIKENTLTGGYNFILCMASKNNSTQKNKEKFYPSLDELKSLFIKWDIVKSGEYETPMEEHDNLAPHKHKIVYILAKRIK